MRSYLPEFPVAAPETLEGVLAALAARPGQVTPLAGGTDLMVLLNAGQLSPTSFVSLHRVDELRGLEWGADRLTMGALATYADARRDPAVRARLPLLEAASAELGALQIQNCGTWAGNVANASPAADGVPALIAYDGEVELASVRGRRWVALAGYYEGYKKTVRAPDELITRLRVHVPARGAHHYFRKVGTRRLQAISKVVACGVLECGPDDLVTRVRFVLGSVAPVTLRALRVEAAVAGRPLTGATIEEACHAVARDISPIDDVRSTRAYRLTIATRLVREFLSRGAAGG